MKIVDLVGKNTTLVIEHTLFVCRFFEFGRQGSQAKHFYFSSRAGAGHAGHGHAGGGGGVQAL